MSISESDILFYYSQGPGGISQVGPAASLGGEIASLITTDKLFDNVTKDQTQKGIVDYRCIYIKNNSSTDALTNFDISITEYLPSTIQFGFDGVTLKTVSGSITNATGDGSIVTYTYKTKETPVVAGKVVNVINITPNVYKFTGIVTACSYINTDLNGFDIYQFTVNSNVNALYVTGGTVSQQTLVSLPDIQKITFNYTTRPSEGVNNKFYFVYESETQLIDWKNTVAEQAIEIRNKINNIIRLSNTKVSYSAIPGAETYTLEMYNQRFRKGPIFINLHPALVSAGVTSSVTEIQNGAPLNKITTPVLNKFTKPSNITFLDATKNFTIDSFYPQDTVGMWIKRTVFPNTIPDDNDGFAINIAADGDVITITPTPSPTTGPTPTPSATPFGWTYPPTATPTSTPTLTPTPTTTPTPTPTPSATPFDWTYPPTSTPTPTPTTGMGGPFYITLSGEDDYYELVSYDNSGTSITWAGRNAQQSITLVIYPEDFFKYWGSPANGNTNTWTFFFSINSINYEVGSLSIPDGLITSIYNNNYKIDANSTANSQPSNRYLRYNNLTQTSSTSLYISHLNAQDSDIDQILSSIVPGDTLLIKDAGNAANYQKFNVTGSVNPGNNDYVQVPVGLVNSGGTGSSGFANNLDVVIALYRSTLASSSGRRQFILNSTCTSLGSPGPSCCPNKENINVQSTFPNYSSTNPPGTVTLIYSNGGYPNCS